MSRKTAILCAALALGASGCARSLEHHLIDAAMATAYRPEWPLGPGAGIPSSRYTLLAGDMHCHISPPDAPRHVSRGLEETIELARAEGLDFVVLAPHVRSRFFLDPSRRDDVLRSLAALEQSLPREAPGEPIFVVGFEYTDHSWGHVGGAFGDLAATLAAVPEGDAWRRPERFFEEYAAHGGLLIVNHPLLTPLDSFVPALRHDMSWRPFTGPAPYPAEIAAADRLAIGFEAYNVAVTELRDRIVQWDTTRSLSAVLARLDREIVARGRRMVPTGGSDSHSGYLRAATFVLSEARTKAAIRDAVRAGRVCVRGPEACSLEVRANGGPWLTVGSSLVNATELEARARGSPIRILVNGVELAAPASGEAVRIPLDRGRCSVVRATIGESYSAPVYANCGF